KAAIELAKQHDDRPSLIICQTVIGFGAPNMQGTAATHGAPLGDDEIAAARRRLDWPHAPFHVPEPIYQAWDAREAGAAAHSRWQEGLARYRADHPELAREFQRRMQCKLPAEFPMEALVQQAQEKGESIASRQASLSCLNALGPRLPELLGGSADLAP